MNDAELIERYQLLYRMLGAQGREELLFGSCGEPALEAFRSCAVGSSMPTVYVELPMAGEPRFDLQVCLNRSDLLGSCALPAMAPPVLEPLLAWARESDGCLGVDLAFDVASGELSTPQVMAMMRTDGQHDGSLRNVEGFFSAAGDAHAARRYRAVAEHAPKGWVAWYVGLASQRPGRPVRLDYDIAPKLQGAYLAGRRSLGDDLRAMGYDASEEQLRRCHSLLGLPFVANLQLDVLDDGSLGPVLGYSLAMPKWGPARSREELAHGALADAFSLMMAWGLADDRWQQVAGCCIGSAVKLSGRNKTREVAIRSVPTFLKVRMTSDGPLDAKTYIMCSFKDLDSHPAGTSEA